MCVSVSNFDWKTCLTSCDFSQPLRAYNTAGQCDWRQLSGISDTTSSCSVEQFVSHYGSQSLNQSVNQQGVELASYRRQQQHVWQLLMELRQALLTHFSVRGRTDWLPPLDWQRRRTQPLARSRRDLVNRWLHVLQAPRYTHRCPWRMLPTVACCCFFSLFRSPSRLSLFRFDAWQAIRINCNKLAKRQQAAGLTHAFDTSVAGCLVDWLHHPTPPCPTTIPSNVAVFVSPTSSQYLNTCPAAAGAAVAAFECCMCVINFSGVANFFNPLPFN